MTRLMTCEYDEIIWDDESRNDFPELAAAIDSYNADTLKGSESAIEEYSQTAKQQYEDNQEYFMEYSDDYKVNFARVDDQVFSFISSYYGYSGGAHGYYGNDGVNFDVATGEKIKLSDVISDEDKLLEVLLEKLKTDYPELMENEPGAEENLIGYITGENREYLSWVMMPYGVTFFFNPYALGSYAAGAQEVTITYLDNPELFTDKYSASGDEWAISSSEAYVDVDGDGKSDHIYTDNDYEYYDNYSEVKAINIYVNDKNYSFDDSCFNYDNIFIAKHADAYFMYVIALHENDYHGIDIYMITGEDVTKSGSFFGNISARDIGFDYTSTENAYSEMKGVLYNPNHFYLSSRMDLISTFGAVKTYHMDKVGRAVPDEGQLFRVSDASGPDLSTKVEITAKEVDEEGNVGEDITIPAGKKFKVFRTDDEAFADCRLEDGSLFRLEVDKSDWPRKINGKELEEVIDGTIFAG